MLSCPHLAHLTRFRNFPWKIRSTAVGGASRAPVSGSNTTDDWPLCPPLRADGLPQLARHESSIASSDRRRSSCASSCLPRTKCLASRRRFPKTSSGAMASSCDEYHAPPP